MTLFVDTANFEEAKKWVQQYGVCSGITTNQKIFSMEKGIDYRQRIKELLKFNVPVSVELTGQNYSVEELIEEAESYVYDFRKKYFVIKVPMWKDGKGLEVAKSLLDKEFKVNMTCLMDMNQVVLACEVGATYASLFYRRMVDYKCDLTQTQEERALGIIRQCRAFINRQGWGTRIICGSIREPQDVSDCLANGAHIVTVTPKVLEQLPFHLKTEETIQEFDEAWKGWGCNKEVR